MHTESGQALVTHSHRPDHVKSRSVQKNGTSVKVKQVSGVHREKERIKGKNRGGRRRIKVTNLVKTEDFRRM